MHVLITGSSTGIGRACALYPARRGYSVLAAVRKEADGAALQKEAGSALKRRSTGRDRCGFYRHGSASR